MLLKWRGLSVGENIKLLRNTTPHPTFIYNQHHNTFIKMANKVGIPSVYKLNL